MFIKGVLKIIVDWFDMFCYILAVKQELPNKYNLIMINTDKKNVVMIMN